MKMIENGEVRIGGKDGEFVSVRRLTRTGPEGWFEADVEVHCDCWHGKSRASFMRGEARLEPIEPHLTLSFAGDGKGHIEVVGTAQDHLGSGTKLSFWLEADQTYLPAIARALRAADSTE